MTQKRRKEMIDKSCVFKAFEKAGLPTKPYMRVGVEFGEVVELLRGHGYQFKHRGQPAVIPAGLFVFYYYGADEGHVEYFDSIDGVDFDDAFLVAFK